MPIARNFSLRAVRVHNLSNYTTPKQIHLEHTFKDQENILMYMYMYLVLSRLQITKSNLSRGLNM